MTIKSMMAIIKCVQEACIEQDACCEKCMFVNGRYCKLAQATSKGEGLGTPDEWETTNSGEIKEKPPIGVRPYWVVIPERIDNLAEAIKRYSGTKDTEKVTLWAKEIAYLAHSKAQLDITRREGME